MKIFEIGRQFIKSTSEILEKKLSNSSTIRKHLPENIQLRPQLAKDVFEGKMKLKELKLGEEINSGREARVFNILSQPNLVAKVRRTVCFEPQKLSYKYTDTTRHVIAGTKDNSIIIMKKIEGEPLHGKNWYFTPRPEPQKYFAQLEELKQVPDETFIKYYNDLLELRKKGYEFDTVNPNNILYDAKNKQFNFVDIQRCEPNQDVTIFDFYPFIDGASIGTLFNNTTPEIQYEILKETRMFFDRMEKIGNKIGVDLSNKNYSPAYNHIPYRFQPD